MSWFAADPTVELDAKIEDATSESIPNGEMDMAVAMEITDLIRSKNIPPKQAMRALKKRLTKVHTNPNTLSATLKLCDVCVKNGGSHFLPEINSKEFIDYLVEFIFKVHYDVKNYKVYSSESKHAIGIQILRLVREWSMYLQGSSQGVNYLGRTFETLSNQGYEFPAVDASLASNAGNFVDSQAPPDWIDGRDCMLCYNPFSVMNRKHHCRACGGVFCQTHSSNNIPLVSLGLLEPVRVCDDCFQIHKHASSGNEQEAGNSSKSRGAQKGPKGGTNSSSAQDEDEQLRRAIELSLQDSGVPVSYSEPPAGHVTAPQQTPDDVIAANEDDEEMKAAIAASLTEYKQAQAHKSQHLAAHDSFNHAPSAVSAPPEPESDFYSSLLPSGTTHSYSQNGYQQTVGDTVTQSQSNIEHQQSHPEPEQISPQPIEDLLPQEEEDINLFVQLMQGIKSDPAKQANILYDQNLGELHSKVMRLKPKLNRALRSSIEKYEFFLEMNNKMNSITRLYDQFLDHKLNQAYGKHKLSSPGTSYMPTSETQAPYSQQFFTGRNDPVSSQNTGLQAVNSNTTGYTQELPYQPTAPQFQNQAQNQAVNQTHSRVHSQELPHQETGPHRLADQSVIPQASGYQGNAHSESGHGVRTRAEMQTNHENSKPEHTVPQILHGNTEVGRTSIPYPTNPEVSPERYDYKGSEINVNSQNSQSEHRKETYPGNYANNQNPSYPQMPSSPPSDGISDTESVASRYPALEEKYENDKESEEDGPREHASERFPSLFELNLPDLNTNALPDLKKSSTNESRKYKAEPEPLIEL